MTGPEADARYDELEKRIDEIPDFPPVVVSPVSRTSVVVALVQLVFIAIALIGVVSLVLKVENNRIVQCGYVNQTRSQIVAVLKSAAERPEVTPMQRERLQEQVMQFRPINCKNPSELLPPTTGSLP